jgi:hypothetical protein
LRQKSPAVKRGQALLGGLSFPWFVCVQRRLANSPVFALALSIHTGAGMKVHAKEESRQVKRFYRVMERQRENAWAQDYIPGVLATREEAPSVSKTSRIYWPRVGRDLHALSEPETALLLLAIHHPQTFDVNEQRLLQPVPAPHPLSGHPVHGGLTRPRFEGTLNVAERLGMSKHIRWLALPPVSRAGPPQPGDLFPVAWVGDLLLFIAADADGAYCINWSVKCRDGDHGKKLGWRDRRVSACSADRAHARHAIEVAYYADAEIPTRDVALEQLPMTLRRNLVCLYLDSCRPVPLAESHRRDLEAEFEAGKRAGRPPMETSMRHLLKHRVPLQVSLRALHCAIWHRRIRTDLYRSVLPDVPLAPERRDVLADYAHWFGR